MPVKRRQNLAETRASYYKEERLEEFLHSKVHFAMNNSKVLSIVTTE